MSSSGDVPTAAKPYLCHQCNRIVTLTPIPNSHIHCPYCNDGFLQECHTFDIRNPRIFSVPLTSIGTPMSDHFMLVHDYLQHLREAGVHIQFVTLNPIVSTGIHDQPVRDYILGPGYREIIHRLEEIHRNRQGTPAPKNSVETLTAVEITEELNCSGSAQCVVCINGFELASVAKQMPCKHIFHSDCILPWLELHNSCPVCRYQLPTDNPDYQNRASSSSQGRQRSSAVERSFIIPLDISSNAPNNNDQASGSEDQPPSQHGQESQEQG